MCWMTFKESNATAKIAKQSIFCIKKIELDSDSNVVYSFHAHPNAQNENDHFQYELGKIYQMPEDDIIPTMSTVTEIHKGYHSWKLDFEHGVGFDFRMAQIMAHRIKFSCLYNSLEGRLDPNQYFYWLDPTNVSICAKLSSSSYVPDGYDADDPYAQFGFVLCTIPKGATYYENEYGEYVSNKIILHRITDARELRFIYDAINK